MHFLHWLGVDADGRARFRRERTLSGRPLGGATSIIWRRINLRFSRAAEAFNPAFNAASACRSRLRRRVPRPYSFRQRSITTDSGMMQVGGYRPQFRPHRKAVFEVRYTQARYTAQWWRPTDRARPADCLPIQPALRRAGVRAVNDRLSWRWLFRWSPPWVARVRFA